MPGGVPSAEADQEDETGNTPSGFPPARKPPFTKRPHQPRRRGGQFQNSTGDVIVAYRMLAERQRVGGGDTVVHGFMVSEPPFDRTKDYRDEIESAPLETVQLANLKATQSGVRRDHVRAFVENPNTVVPGRRNLSGVLEDVPVIFRVQTTNVDKYSDDQSRDDIGRFGEGGGGGGGEAAGASGSGSGGGPDYDSIAAPEPSAEQASTLSKYQTDDGYKAINTALRKGQILTPKGQATIAAMDSYFDSVPALKGEIVTYRGLSSMPKGMREGATFSDKTYVSTSFKKELAEDFAGKSGVLMRIRVPKGKKVVAMDSALRGRSRFDEREVLLRRGSKFRIRRISKQGAKTIVEADHV